MPNDQRFTDGKARANAAEAQASRLRAELDEEMDRGTHWAKKVTRLKAAGEKLARLWDNIGVEKDSAQEREVRAALTEWEDAQ